MRPGGRSVIHLRNPLKRRIVVELRADQRLRFEPSRVALAPNESADVAVWVVGPTPNAAFSGSIEVTVTVMPPEHVTAHPGRVAGTIEYSGVMTSGVKAIPPERTRHPIPIDVAPGPAPTAILMIHKVTPLPSPPPNPAPTAVSVPPPPPPTDAVSVLPPPPPPLPTAAVSPGPQPIPAPQRTPSPGSPKEIDVLWNVWPEVGSGAPTFQPVKVLRPDTAYKVYLDLAAFPYFQAAVTGVYSGVASSSFKKWKSDWLAKSAVGDVKLQAIFLASSGYFQNTSNFVRPLRVRLSKIRDASRKGLPSVADPMAALREGPPDPEWQFARTDFSLRTRRNEGMSSIAISIWSADDATIPLDEIKMPVCIAPAVREQVVCAGASAVLESVSGTDSLRLNQEGGLSPPDGAFQFLDSGSGTVYGLFHGCRDCPFVKWEIQESMVSLRERLRAATEKEIEKAADDAELVSGGQTYYDILVPSIDARAPIAAFVQQHLKPNRPAEDQKPSLFIRMLGREFDPLVIPLGLMVVETQGRSPFLGDYFRIEQPLSAQTYEPSAVCISRWVVSAPPAGTDELGIARKAGGAPFESWLQAATVSFEDIPKFRGWVRDDTATEPAGTGLLVLSHQSNDAMWHASQEVGLLAENVRRGFDRPSLAVLDGCGFGGPDAGRFVRNFNGDGIPAIVATTASVQPKMAGDFLFCFGRELSSAADGTTIRKAYAAALECLRTEKNAGAHALFYTLLGNGSVRVCAPKKKDR